MPEAWDRSSWGAATRRLQTQAIKWPNAASLDSWSKWGVRTSVRNQDTVTMIQWVMKQEQVSNKNSLICHYNIPTHCGWVTATSATHIQQQTPSHCQLESRESRPQCHFSRCLMMLSFMLCSNTRTRLPGSQAQQWGTTIWEVINDRVLNGWVLNSPGGRKPDEQPLTTILTAVFLFLCSALRSVVTVFQALINKVGLASNYLLFYWYQVFITTNKQKDTWKEFNHTAEFIHQRALCKFSAGKTLLERHKQEPSESGRI